MNVFLSLLCIFAASSVVGRIEIVGNKISKENFIRREITFLPGDTFSSKALAETRDAILSTGAFKEVSLSYLLSGDTALVKVDVREKKFPMPYPRLGLDASTGLYLGIGVLYPNLFGYGVHIDAGGELGLRFSTPRHRFYTYFYKPLTYNRWHGEKIAYAYSLLWRKDSRIYHREHRICYRQDFRPLRPLSVSLEAGCLFTNAYPDNPADPLPTFSADSVDCSWFLKPILRLDLRDNSYDTRKGFLFQTQFLFNPGFSAEFPTQRACSLSVAGYLPLDEKNWLAANFYTYQQLDSIPVYRTIYLGEVHRVRGWKDTTQVGPCLSVLSFEWRNRFLDLEFNELPLLGKFKMWWGANAFIDIGAIHNPGLPPMYFANLSKSPKDGLLSGIGIGLAAGTGKLVGKLGFSWGLGSGFNGSKISYTIPAYFGWRF